MSDVARIDVPPGDNPVLLRLISTAEERRERIATALMAGLMARKHLAPPPATATDALDFADALIAALDKKP